MGSLPHQENKTWMDPVRDIGVVLPANAATPTVIIETRCPRIWFRRNRKFFALFGQARADGQVGPGSLVLCNPG